MTRFASKSSVEERQASLLETRMIDCFFFTLMRLHPTLLALQIVSLTVKAYGPGTAHFEKKYQVYQSLFFSLESHHCYTIEEAYSESSVLRRITQIWWYHNCQSRRKEIAINSAFSSQQQSIEKASHLDKLATIHHFHFPHCFWISFTDSEN